jgi:ubiquinone/menaquinone biosynthesis C-methylase UbiE
LPGKKESSIFFELLGMVQDREGLLGELASMVTREDKVLDIATGSGYLAGHLRGRGAEVTCLDTDAEAVAKAHAYGLKGVVADAANLPFRDACFSKVLSWSAMVHIPRWRRVLKEAFRVSCVGGQVVVLEPRGAFAVRAFRDFASEHEAPQPEEVLGELMKYSKPRAIERGFATMILGNKTL